MTSSRPEVRVGQPKRSLLPPQWRHAKLHHNVIDALASIQSYFQTDTYIEGISATDIFTLSSVLGAAIENQVVNTLNKMRTVWDPDDRYTLYTFVRQSQTFPDVLLKRTMGDASGGEDVIMGIELKGWYLLAKEAEPSFRYQVTPAVCAPQDLLVIVPWALDNVISGSPKVFTPYIESAKYAAIYRNYHWQKLRDAKSDSTIASPKDVRPYPVKSDLISDKPASDSGNNFGRFARTGIMDAYISRTLNELLCGVQAAYWLKFFKIFQDQREVKSIEDAIEALKDTISSRLSSGRSEKLTIIYSILENIKRIL